MARKITAGETLTLEVSADPAATVTAYFAGPAKKTETLSHVSGSGGTFKASIATGDWLPGVYAYEIREVLSGVTIVLMRSAITVGAALTTITDGTDMRSNAAKAVANIEAMLSGTASLEARRYRINNRELERYSVSELLTLLSFWRRELAKEERKAAGRNELGGRIEVRI